MSLRPVENRPGVPVAIAVTVFTAALAAVGVTVYFVAAPPVNLFAIEPHRYGATPSREALWWSIVPLAADRLALLLGRTAALAGSALPAAVLCGAQSGVSARKHR